MNRSRIYDLRLSSFPGDLGLCVDNVPEICRQANAAQSRLLCCEEASDESWYGTWAEVAFSVSQCAPYITLPREIARLESINVCDYPVKVQNQFFEYLQFGNGRMPKHYRNGWRNWCGVTEALTRNNAVTFVEMTNAPQYLVARLSDAQDIGKRVLFQGLDDSLNQIYSTDVFNEITGIFVVLNSDPAVSPMLFSQIQGIQKDITVGVVRIYQRDPNTGDEILLLTMQPSEQTACYRRYYLNQLPKNCCGTNAVAPIRVTAMAKLDLIPATSDTDYLLIPNIEAIIAEGQSIRMSKMDNLEAQQMSLKYHKDAVKLLNGQLNHLIGKNQVATNMAVFGSAKLGRYGIGTLV